MNKDFRRILIIMFRAVGDVLLCTPFISVLRRHYPDAHIAFMVEPVPGQVLENNPDLDEIIYYRHQKDDVRGSYRFFRETGSKQWDLAIDVLGTPGAAWATIFSGAEVRVGYTVRIRKYAYNIKVNNRVPERYTALKRFDLLKAIGILEETPGLVFRLRDHERDEAEKYYAEQGIDLDKLTVCCAPGSKRQARAWRLDGWSKLCDMLSNDYGANVILLWGPGEEDDVRIVQEGMETKPYVIPPTNIRQMAAIMERTHLCLTNCSGSLHIAVAAGLPTVAFYGPNNPVTWTYPDPKRHRFVLAGHLDCIQCNLRDCSHKTCMYEVYPEDFIREMRNIPELSRFITSKSEQEAPGSATRGIK